MTTKKCSKCKIEKNLERFYLYKKTNKYRSVCKDCQNLLDYEWKKNNKEKIKAIKQKYRENNREKILQDTKKRNIEWYSKNKNNVSLKRHGLSERFRRYIYNCKTKKRDFFLSKEDFEIITSKACYYCGGYNISENSLIDITNLNYCGIDRIDNSKSYIKENCVPCCNICNRMKLDMNLTNFIEHIKKIVGFCK